MIPSRNDLSLKPRLDTVQLKIAKVAEARADDSLDATSSVEPS